MARSIVDIFARLLADDSGFEADVVRKSQKAGDKAGMSMGQAIAAGVSRSATDIGRTLGSIGQNLSRTGRSLTTNLTLPIVAAGAAVTHFALEFDTTMRRIVGLTDITAGEIDDVREAILAMGPAVGKGPQELGEAFYFLASAGFKANEALEVLETSAKASASGLGDTQTIAQVLGGVINAYGRENITAARAADILTEAVSQGTAEASGLASVIGNVVPGAAALGVSFDQVTAAMAGMTLTGVGVEESATSLIQIFSSLQKPTSQAEEALRGMGLSSAELRRQLREEGLLATLRTLEERFAGNETAAAAVFGNIRALRGVTALLTLDSEQLNAVFAKVEGSAGRLAEAYEETEGPQRELDRAMAQLHATAIQFGDDTLPSLVTGMQNLAAAAKELGRMWRLLDADTRGAIVQFLGLVAVVGPALFIMGKLVGAVAGLFKVVGLLAGPKGLATLPAKLGAFMRVAGRIVPLLLLVDTLFKLEDVFGAVGDAIDGFSRNSPRQVIRAARAINDAIPSIFNPLHDATARMLDDMEAELDAGLQDISESWGGGWGERGPIVRATEEGVDLVAQVLEDGSVEIGNAADVMVDPVAAAMAEAREKVAQETLALIADMIANLATGPEEIEDEVQALIDAVLNPFTDAARIAELRGALASQALADGLTSADPRIRAIAFQQAQDWLHEWELIDPTIFDIGSGFLPSLTGGMQTNLQAAVDWVAQTMGIDFVNQFDLADQLEVNGEHALAAFVRGNEQARLSRLAAEQALLKTQMDRKFQDIRTSAYGYGAGTTRNYAAGLTDPGAMGYLNDKANVIKTTTSRILQFADSPPYTLIKKIGANVGRFWLDEIMGSVRAGLPELASLLGGAASAMAIAPGMTGLSSYPAQNLTTPMPGTGLAPAGAVSSVVNNFNLNVTGGISVDEARDAVIELRRLAEIE